MAKSVPMRQCVGCGELKEKRSLLRVLKTEDGIVLDTTGRKNGRGAYVCAKTECFLKAVKTKGLERSLKTVVPEEIKQEIKEEISQLEKR